MQPVTVAISPTGIGYLLATLLGDQIASALKANLVAPDYSTPIPSFVYNDWGPITETNITVSLTKGAIKTFTPKFTGYTQDPDDSSKFHITMTATDLDVSYTWTERYTETVSHGWPSPVGPNAYNYDITFDSFAVAAIFQLAVSGGAYRLSYVSSSVQSSSPTAHVPSGSVLNHQPAGGCSYATHVSNATAQQLSSMDFGSKLSGALQPIFATIAESGKLGPVEFDFLMPGNSGLVFPGGGGIQIGATGAVRRTAPPTRARRRRTCRCRRFPPAVRRSTPPTTSRITRWTRCSGASSPPAR